MFPFNARTTQLDVPNQTTYTGSAHIARSRLQDILRTDRVNTMRQEPAQRESDSLAPTHTASPHGQLLYALLVAPPTDAQEDLR